MDFLTQVILAFCAGAVGTVIGGMEAFIVYGVIALIGFILSVCGVDVATYNTYVANLFFLPAVMFSATVPATGYAAKHYDIQSWEIDRSLAFAHDPMTFLIGGFTGVCGFLLFTFAVYAGIPMDQGSFSVVTVALLSRLIFPRPQIINKDALRVINDGQRWGFLALMTIVIAIPTAFFVQLTGNASIGFIFSAISLLLQLFPKTRDFPTTHQITMVTGYAMLASGNIGIAVLFALLAELIFTLFADFFNMGCGTHIDPPAVSIGLCSLIIFLIF